jgi:hypothetical protein
MRTIWYCNSAALHVRMGRLTAVIVANAGATLSQKTVLFDLPDQHQTSGLRSIKQALEQDKDLARLDGDVGVDRLLIETIGRQTRLDFDRGSRIEPPTQHVLTGVIVGLVLELRRDANHVDTA